MQRAAGGRGEPQAAIGPVMHVAAARQLAVVAGQGDVVGDQAFESNGVKLFVDPVSISYLKGAEVDFVDTITGGGFTIKNPNATSTCGCGQSFNA